MRKSTKFLMKLFLSFLTLFIFSCNDELSTEEDTHINNIKREKIDLEKFKQNREAYFLYSKLKASKSVNKKENSDLLDFEVNFNNGIHLTYLDLESFTFPIRRIFGNRLLENLVISKHSDGKYYAKILKYNLTLQEKVDLENGELKHIQNSIQTEVLGEMNFENSTQSETCYETVQVISSCGSGEHHAGNIASWVSCKSSTLPSIRTVTIASDCGGNSGGGGYYGDGTGGVFGDPFNAGGGGDGYVSPIFPDNSTPVDFYENGISEPVLDTGYQYQSNQPLDIFVESLTYNQYVWLVSQSLEVQQSILDSLVASNFSTEIKNKITNLINIANQNNIDIEYINSSISNSNSVNLIDFIQSMKNEIIDNSSGSIGLDNQNRHVSTKVISLNGLNNLALEVVTNPLPNFSIVPGDSTSYLSNTIIGNTWVQNSMNITNINYSLSQAEATLLGYINSGVTWESFEIGFKFRKKVVFLINKNNGQIGSAFVYNLN